MIKLIVLDVDGTLTDGKIIYGENGEELKNFNAKDGLAIAVWIKKLGKKIAIITGRKSTIVEKRAKELGINHLYQGIYNKVEMIEKILKEENINWSEVASIGDDLNDMKMLKKSAISFAPNDASHYITNIVKKICKKNGGDGAVREMIEYICKYDLEEEFLDIWE
jgi:3-deoxy-D-manno-octulosonate 8-phosphate phosphatase (KDO 8-P phosphatase)